MKVVAAIRDGRSMTTSVEAGIPMTVVTDVRAVVARVANELMQDLETVGVVFHGSAARGKTHADSDVDIVCFTDGDSFVTEKSVVDGVPVEVNRIPEARARQLLHHTTSTNLNFMVNALTSGVVVADTNGRIHALVAEARRVADEGPTAPSDAERDMGSEFLRNRLAELKRVHAAGDPQRVFRVFADLYFYNCVYAYCRTHRRWSGKFTYMLDIIRGYDPSFHELCQSYLHAETTRESLELLERMADHVMQPIGWGARTFRARVGGQDAGLPRGGFAG